MTCGAWRVSGIVQGVGFRAFVYQEARALGLTGFVRNCADGSVEVLACGPAPARERLLAALWRGPAGARVAAVDPWDREAESAADFRIL